MDEPGILPSPERPTQQQLVDLLDPERDYGDRTYLDVLSGIDRGTILIRPGARLPMLVSSTGGTIRGTGQPPRTGVTAQQHVVARMRELALDDIDEAYRSLRDGMRRGDPRYDKIWWEYAAGKSSEFKGSDAMAEAFKHLVDMLDKPEAKSIVIES